jgi:hypothetical protein
MQLLKRIGRMLILTIFIILASFGLGMFGLNFRERFLNKETQIELVEKKNEEDDFDKNESKE